VCFYVYDSFIRFLLKFDVLSADKLPLNNNSAYGKNRTLLLLKVLYILKVKTINYWKIKTCNSNFKVAFDFPYYYACKDK